MSYIPTSFQDAYTAYGVPAYNTAADTFNFAYNYALDTYNSILASPDVQKTVNTTTALAQKHLNPEALAKKLENSTLNKIAPVRTEDQILLELKDLKKKAFINAVLKENNEKRIKEYEAKIDNLVAEQIKVAEKENNGGILSPNVRKGLESKKKQLIKEAERLAQEIENLNKQLELLNQGSENNKIKKDHVLVKQRVQQATNVVNLLPVNPVIKGAFALGGKAIVGQSAQRLPENSLAQKTELKQAENGAYCTTGAWSLSQLFNFTIVPLIRQWSAIGADEVKARLGLK